MELVKYLYASEWDIIFLISECPTITKQSQILYNAWIIEYNVVILYRIICNIQKLDELLLWLIQIYVDFYIYGSQFIINLKYCMQDARKTYIFGYILLIFILRYTDNW